MSGNGEFELQTAVYSALNGDSALGALVTGVYDFVPPNTDLPYVVVGDDTLEWDGTMGVDWSNATVNIHSWAYGEGRKAVKQIKSAVYDVLHKGTLTISGKTHVSTLQEYSDTFVEDDGVYHGIQRFRVTMHEPF